MAVVKPFHGLRFTQQAGQIQDLVCPPYDIISEEERKELLNTNPHNVIRLELPREGEDVYQKAGEALQEWLQKGILATEKTEQFYIYEEAFTVDGVPYHFKGLIARVQLTDFKDRVVIPHENTLSAAKEDRFQLMKATGCNFSQVYCLFEDPDKAVCDRLESVSNNLPIHEFTDNEGVTHRFWSADASAGFTELFENKCLFIADGHHRYETGLRYRDAQRQKGAIEGADSDYIMMMLVPMESEGLVVFPTHRIIHSLPDFDGRQLLLKAREFFHVGEISSQEVLERHLKKEYANKNCAFGAYFGGRYYLLTLKNRADLQILTGMDDSLRQLDVTVLHHLILERLMGIDKENMAKQINLRYTRDMFEAAAAVDDGANCAFLLNPTRVEEIAAVSLAGEKMPQKSTYFYPKLITGLVINKMENTL